MEYRKRPVVVEAEPVRQLCLMSGVNPQGLPTWVKDAHFNGCIKFYMTGLTVKTLEGEMLASLDDMLIRGIKGEIYPCKPDIFDLTYELDL